MRTMGWVVKDGCKFSLYLIRRKAGRDTFHASWGSRSQARVFLTHFEAEAACQRNYGERIFRLTARRK